MCRSVDPLDIALKGPHPVFASCFMAGGDFMVVAVADMRPHGVGRQEQFAFGDARLGLPAKTQPLRQHSHQAVSQLGTHRSLNLWRERPYQTLERFGR